MTHLSHRENVYINPDHIQAKAEKLQALKTFVSCH